MNRHTFNINLTVTVENAANDSEAGEILENIFDVLHNMAMQDSMGTGIVYYFNVVNSSVTVDTIPEEE